MSNRTDKTNQESAVGVQMTLPGLSLSPENGTIPEELIKSPIIEGDRDVELIPIPKPLVATTMIAPPGNQRECTQIIWKGIEGFVAGFIQFGFKTNEEQGIYIEGGWATIMLNLGIDKPKHIIDNRRTSEGLIVYLTAIGCIHTASLRLRELGYGGIFHAVRVNATDGGFFGRLADRELVYEEKSAQELHFEDDRYLHYYLGQYPNDATDGLEGFIISEAVELIVQDAIKHTYSSPEQG